jgi:hypothetical protein
MDRVKEQISQHGVRVREINEQDKELEREIKDRQAQRERLAIERDKELYAIRSLEMALEEDDRKKSWSEWNRNKRPGDPLSVTVLMEQILEKHQTGLKLEALMTELEKLGFQTNSKKPTAILTSTLHRHRPNLFTRLKDGRWCLTKYAPAPLQNVVQFKSR